MRLISEIEQIQNWLVNHNDKELSISANSRYGILIQLREFVINKYGRDIYNEIITGKKVIKNKKIKVLSYEPEPETFQIPFNEPENSEPINYIKTEIHTPEKHNWNEIVNSIFGIYNEIITEKKVIKNEKINVLSYKPEPETFQIPFNEPEKHNWNEIVNSILGTYWDYIYVRETIMETVGQ